MPKGCKITPLKKNCDYSVKRVNIHLTADYCSIMMVQHSIEMAFIFAIKYSSLGTMPQQSFSFSSHAWGHGLFHPTYEPYTKHSGWIRTLLEHCSFLNCRVLVLLDALYIYKTQKTRVGFLEKAPLVRKIF